MGPHYKLLGLLFVLFIVMRYGDCGKSKKSIKIHVPYYVKHIHHYKKVYVPKVQVIKHEHHHKKEHDHHHHHHHGHDHEHDHEHHHSYDKAGHEYGDESTQYDNYYDEIDSRKYSDEKYGARRGKLSYREGQKYRDWKDVDGSEYINDDSGEQDYEEYEPSTYRSKPKSSIVIPIYRKKVFRSNARSDDLSHETILSRIPR